MTVDNAVGKALAHLRGAGVFGCIVLASLHEVYHNRVLAAQACAALIAYLSHLYILLIAIRILGHLRLQNE